MVEAEERKIANREEAKKAAKQDGKSEKINSK